MASDSTRLHMHLASMADENYAVGVAVTLRSALAASMSIHAIPAGPLCTDDNSTATITVWLMDLGLSMQSKSRLQRLVDGVGSTMSNAQGNAISYNLEWLAWDQHIAQDCDHMASTVVAAKLAEVGLGNASSLLRDNVQTWAKFQICQQMPDHVECFLYLDSDTLVRDNLWPLWLHTCNEIQKESSKEKPIWFAAVQDQGWPWGHPGLALLSPWKVGHDMYFNAGVLLMNRKAMKEVAAKHGPLLGAFSSSITTDKGSGSTSTAVATQDTIPRCHPPVSCNPVPNNIPRQAQEYEAAPDGTVTVSDAQGCRQLPERSLGSMNPLEFQDQDILNLACLKHGRWLPLPHVWNVQGIGTYLRARCKPGHACSDEPALFTHEECNQLESCPSIIHFTGTASPTPSMVLNPLYKEPTKPWAYICDHPHKELFFQVLDETPWCGWRPDQGPVASAAAKELVRFARHVAEDKPQFDVLKFLDTVATECRQACTRRDC